MPKKTDGTEGASGAERASSIPGSSPEPSRPVIDAAMRLAARGGWRGLTLRDLAAEAGMPLSALHAQFPSATPMLVQNAILNGLMRHIDATVLAAVEAEPVNAAEGERPRDRVFDVLMRRFDALLPYRDALKAITRDRSADPLAVLCSVPQLGRSMAWMLEAANVDTGGLVGALKVQGLGAVHASVLRVWFDDDTADLARTMAALDARLRRAEDFLNRVPFSTRRTGPGPAGKMAGETG